MSEARRSAACRVRHVLTPFCCWSCAAAAVWPNGSPDGGSLLHSAAKHGCYDIGQILVVDYGLDPQEAAEAGAGMGGKTPYDLCVGAREESVAKGEPEKYVRNTPLLFCSISWCVFVPSLSWQSAVSSRAETEKQNAILPQVRAGLLGGSHGRGDGIQGKGRVSTEQRERDKRQNIMRHAQPAACTAPCCPASSTSVFLLVAVP